LAFTRRPAAPAGSASIAEVSRFSCMKFPGVPWFFDYAGLIEDFALAPSLMLLSTTSKVSASRLVVFGAQSPSPPVPLFTLRRPPRGGQRKTRGRVDRYSFLVRLFHSLLHAGLSRRTEGPTRATTLWGECRVDRSKAGIRSTLFFVRSAGLWLILGQTVERLEVGDNSGLTFLVLAQSDKKLPEGGGNARVKRMPNCAERHHQNLPQVYTDVEYC
jgi:hypothetical protein